MISVQFISINDLKIDTNACIRLNCNTFYHAIVINIIE